MEPVRLILSIDPLGKAIPYSEIPRVDTPSNHGFKVLRGAPSLISEIPEAQDTPAFLKALKVLNTPESVFFTIGCEKAFNENDGKHWARGYIDIAWNYREMVADATNYFPLFFHFDNHLRNAGADLPAYFHWIVQGGQFLDAACSGWSLVTWINTADFSSAAEARAAWEAAVDFQTGYLSGAQVKENLTPIY